MHIKTGCLAFSFLISLPLFGMDNPFSDANCFSEEDLQLIEEIKYLARKAGNEEVNLNSGPLRRSTALKEVIKDLELENETLYDLAYSACSLFPEFSDKTNIQAITLQAMTCEKAASWPKSRGKPQTTQEKNQEERKWLYRQHPWYAQITCKIGQLLSHKNSPEAKKKLQIILANTPLTKPAENQASSKSREKLQRLALEAENPYINGEVDFSEEYKKVEKMGKKAGYIVGPLYPNLTIPDTSDHFRQFREKLLSDCNDKTKKMESDQEVSTGYVRSAKIDCQAAKLLGITYHPDEVMETELKEIARKRVHNLRRLLLLNDDF